LENYELTLFLISTLPAIINPLHTFWLNLHGISKTFKCKVRKIKTMTKTITIDVPDEIEEILKKNPGLRDMLRGEFVKKIAYSEMEKGRISSHLLDLVIGEEDTVKALEDESEILKRLREKAKERVNHGN